MRDVLPFFRRSIFDADQRGNALWLLLIAIVLIGAVTMVLSRSGSSVEQSGGFEQARVKAAQIMRYAKGMETAVQQLQSNGCSENDISFENDVVADLKNTNNADNESCFVFSVKGAGLTWQNFSAAKLFNDQDGVVLDQQAVLGVGTDGGAAENADLLLMIETSESVCLQANRELGISTDAADIVTSFSHFDTVFQGQFSAPAQVIGDADAPGLKGRMAGCILGKGGEYLFYQVLMAR